MSDWTDAIVGERMTVDREFTERVTNSQFTNQQWGLIMTAVEFEIEHPDDPERARIVADTEKVPQIMPELERVSKQMGAMGGGGGGVADNGSSGALGNVVADIKEKLLGGAGGGGGPDKEKLEAAERLAQEYADELQRHLEGNGRFEQVRLAYQE